MSINKLKSVYIRTFGCQMNARDSELALGLFVKKGWKIAESLEDANLILFNTCSVRAHAEERVWGNVGMLRKLKEKKPDLIIGIIGCMAQRLGSKIFKQSGLVDIVCGTSDEEKLPELVEEFIKTRNHILSVSNFSKSRKEVDTGYRINKISAFVSIAHGCDNFCSYCIVPYVRGKEISRKPEDIIREIKTLAEKDIKEVTLLGQNVNSYQRCQAQPQRNSNDVPGTFDFVKLLEQVNDIDGIEKIRFMTSHPKDANEELFKAMAELPKVVKHLHLPLQSGSDKILKLMNRGYTAKKYISLVKKLKNIVPNCNITTDIIVGFPGETEADFKKTRDLMEKIKFNAAYIFKYSPRPPAAASKMEDSVSQKEKENRNQTLLVLQRQISKRKIK